MEGATIKCPKCGEVIELSKAMAGPMVDRVRADYEKRLADNTEKAREEREMLKTKITTDALRKARAEVEDESAQARIELQHKLEKSQHEQSKLATELEERGTKLAEAQKVQAELMKKSRALDDERREMELTIEKRISESLGSERQKARQEAESSLNLKLMEREQTIASMQTKIEELKQKAEQGSMQIQGEVQELQLEKTLRSAFPHDVVSEVPKGINGADCVQEVKTSAGQRCGTIIWESKRTKAWVENWLAKLRDDQRTAKAEMAILVTQVLPKDVQGFALIDGVWVCSMELALPVATALRHALLEVALVKGAGEGQKSKMEILYAYLTGTQYRQRVQAIVEAFTSMQEDLLKEKKAMLKVWAKREEQLNNVVEATCGMYGDVQGIAGKAVKEIEGLELKQITQQE